MAAAAREESEPKTEHICAQFWGWEVAVAGKSSQNPETSICARFGVGGTVVAAREESGPQKPAGVLAFEVGKWCWQAVGSQNPETSMNACFGDV